MRLSSRGEGHRIHLPTGVIAQGQFAGRGTHGSLDTKRVYRIAFGGSGRIGARCAAEGVPAEKRAGQVAIKITDLRCAIIGKNPMVRIVTDQGVSGYGQAESYKPYLKPMVLFYKKYLIGEDPTNVARVMLKIRRLGASKPWGAAVSAIEIALWDIAGRWPVPVYKLLGGKIRDRVRITGTRPRPMSGHTLRIMPRPWGR